MRYCSLPKMNYQTTSLRPRGSASTVALRVLMEQAQKIEIGQRIRGLREDSAETNRSIADYCDVSVEAVRNWIAGKGIAYDNGEKVAEMFGVNFNWLWRGKGPPRGQEETPDVLGELSPSSESAAADDEIRTKLDELLSGQAELLSAVSEVRSEQERLRSLQPHDERGEEETGT